MEITRSFSKRQPEKSDVLLSIGIVSLFYGCFCIDPAVAYIVTGIIFCVLAVITARGAE